MEKEPSAENQDQPLPVIQPVLDTVKTAFKPVRKSPYVSHCINGKKTGENPALASGNHAFYIGKIIRRATYDKIKKVLKWKSAPDPIYNEDFIAGGLEYLFANAGPDEKVRVVVCPVLSEIFNGPKDAKLAMTTEEEIELIYKLAAKKFGKGRDRLEVVDLEKEPLHRELFRVLRAATDPDTGEFDPQMAFGEQCATEANVPGENLNSLDIARCLYSAVKENENFAMRLKKGIPAKLKAEGDGDLPTSFYSLTEIAIRLAEIINGRNIHGGSNRQAVYDEVIEALIKGNNKGSFRHVAALQPLFKLLEGKRFETLHLDNGKNPHHLRGEKMRALVRLATAGIIGAAAVAAPVGVQQYREKMERETREEVVKKYINDQLKNLDYYIDGKFRAQVDVTEVNMLTGHFFREIGARYGIPPEAIKDLRLGELYKQFLIQNKSMLTRACTEEKYFVLTMDLFIQNNRILLESYGIRVGKPYERLAPYLEYLLEAAEKPTPELSVDVEKGACVPQDPRPCRPGKELEKLGLFFGHQTHQQGFELYLFEENNGRKYLVARDYYAEEDLKQFGLRPDMIATSKKAAGAARQYLKSMKLFDLINLLEWERLFHNLHEDGRLSGDYVDDLVEAEEEPLKYVIERSRTYKDYFGAFEYELIEDDYHDPNDDKWKRCLKARIPGRDVNFTIARAREAAVHFREGFYGDSY